MTVVPFPIAARLTHEGQTEAVRSFNAWMRGQGIPYFVWRRPKLNRYDILAVRDNKLYATAQSFRTLHQCHRHFAGDAQAKLIAQRMWPLLPEKENS